MSRRFRLENAWRAVLRDQGIHADTLLRRAGLPPGLFKRADPMVDVEQYYLLWDALAEELGDPDAGLALGQSLSLDAFDPALFAAACSPNMEIATQRISQYKQLFGPFALDIDRTTGGLRTTFRCVDRPDVPRLLGISELVFQVHWIRHATRAPVRPVEVTLPDVPANPAYAEYFGIAPTEAPRWTVTFSELDARRPFLTANPGMWENFEPVLRRRLTELDAETSTREKVAAALLELLPSGRTQKADAARALGMGEKTLQRRLRGEGVTYQEVLTDVRERLARHYLVSTEMAPAEIAYLLGYDDPNSLFRAFQQWTGTTPESVRRAARGQA